MYLGQNDDFDHFLDFSFFFVLFQLFGFYRANAGRNMDGKEEQEEATRNKSEEARWFVLASSPCAPLILRYEI